MIAIHPVAGPVPATVRWQMPAGTLPVRGPAVELPAPLHALLEQGAVEFVVVGDDHVEITLTEGRDWSREGPTVRSALLAALEAPGEWRTGADVDSVDAAKGEVANASLPGSGWTASDDEALRAAAEVMVAGDVGELARSHGGRIELDSVADGVVTVRMRGACHGCPAAGLTLHARLEKDLRVSFPALREVRSLEPEGRRLGPTFLGLLRGRDES